MNSFEGVNIEDILYCPNLNYGSGLKTKLFYAPASFFLNFNLPPDNGSYTEIIEIPKEGIEFKGGGWSFVDILIDENELRLNLPGNQQRKRIKSELEIFILGMTSEVLGFIKMHKNTPMIFGVIDSNNNSWIIGNLRNRAFVDTADATSGKKYEDTSGASIKITCNSPFYYYSGKLEQIELAGSFTKGYSLGFKS